MIVTTVTVITITMTTIVIAGRKLLGGEAASSAQQGRKGLLKEAARLDPGEDPHGLAEPADACAYSRQPEPRCGPRLIMQSARKADLLEMEPDSNCLLWVSSSLLSFLFISPVGMDLTPTFVIDSTL